MVEGGGSSDIEINTSVPPSLFCKQGGDAKLQATVLVGAFDGPKTCNSGADLRQVVVGRRKSDLPNDRNNSSPLNIQSSIPGGALIIAIPQNQSQSGCQTILDDMTWREGFVIPLRATIDLVKDGDRRGSIYVAVSVSCLPGTEVLVNSTVQVSFFRLCVIEKLL